MISFEPSALEVIAGCLVSDQVTHTVLDRKFKELNIVEPAQPKPEYAKRFGLQEGVDYWVKGPSKQERLLRAVNVKYRESGGNGVLQLIKTLYPPVSYTANPDVFREFCNRINRILRFSGVEYRDDGNFHGVSKTRDLTEARERARRVENKLAARRVHPEVQRYCKSEYMVDNYFHAVLEASKGLAERIREKTGLTIDGVNLINQSFDRAQSGLPKLAFNSLQTETKRNEHDGFKNLMVGSFQFFRNPLAHTPKIDWRHDVEDAVDCLTLISFLHYRLDDCHPTGR